MGRFVDAGTRRGVRARIRRSHSEHRAQTSRHLGATAVDLVPLDPEALKDVRLVLGERLGLGVAIRRSGKGGKLVLSWRDLDQLETVLRLLKPGTVPHPGDA